MPGPSKIIDKNETVLRARALRRRLSLPEALLWQVLQTRPEGFKFRCQHPIDWYIVDFYCAAAKLASRSMAGVIPWATTRNMMLFVTRGFGNGACA